MKITASCHCCAIELTADCPSGISGNRCTCSFCKRRQAAAVTATTASVKIIKGTDALSTYSFGTHTAQHYFCKNCGIYTHHQRRIDPSQTGINLGCIDGTHPIDQEPIPWTDG